MKKILYFSGILAFFILGFLVVFWPRAIEVQPKQYYLDQGITDKTFSQYVEDNPERKVYYFCKNDDSDCSYTNNVIFKSMASNLIVDTLDFINYVDLSDVDAIGNSKSKRQWEITDLPGFSIIEGNSDGGYTVISSLSWDSNKPLTFTMIKEWLITNNQWPTQTK